MSTTHTPGPWKYRPNKHDDWGFIRDSEGHLVARSNDSRISCALEDEFRAKKKDPYEPNGLRIVACVNALEGIDEPGQWVEDSKRLAVLSDQMTERFVSVRAENKMLRDQVRELESWASTLLQAVRESDQFKSQFIEEQQIKLNQILGIVAGA